MEAVPGAVGLAPAKVAPLGLGTAALESFTGYVARMGAKIAVPTTPIFVRRALQDAEGAADLPLRSAVTAAARRLNVREPGSRVAAAVTGLTGHPGLERLSYSRSSISSAYPTAECSPSTAGGARRAAWPTPSAMSGRCCSATNRMRRARQSK